MRRLQGVIRSMVGLVAAALGWAAGAAVGSNLARTVLATMLTAVALGLLARRPRVALLAGLGTAVATAVAFIVGRSTITPLMAWPVAGLVIGLSGWALVHRTRARVAALVATPLLGTLGFVLGLVLTAFAGMGANDPLVAGQFLWGGAAGFGLLTIAAMRLASRLERAPVPAGGVS